MDESVFIRYKMFTDGLNSIDNFSYYLNIFKMSLQERVNKIRSISLNFFHVRERESQVIIYVEHPIELFYDSYVF